MKLRNHFFILLLVFNSATFASSNTSPLTASKDVSPDEIQGTIKIDAEDLLDLYAGERDLVIIDARIKADRRQGHIEGSVSLPDIDTNCESLAEHLPGLATPVVLYCNGPKCGRSAISSKIAVKCGYHNIYWFRGGMEEWMDKKYPMLK